MKKSSLYRFVFVGMLAVGFCAVQNTFAQGPLGEILKRMDDHNKALKSVQADVTMVKLNTQLNEPDTYIGSTSYLPNANGKRYMRLDWTKPAVEQVSVIGDDYRLYKPSINQVYIGKVNKAKTSAGAGNALGLMSMSREQLRANYNVVYLGTENAAGVSTWHLQLTPKAATNYKSAELWVDTNGMPVQAKVLEQNNDTTTVTLQSIRKNVQINTKIFVLDIPKGAKEIKV
ncbi:MAG: outer-membrane lipoprotein carrier protein LolA [Pyrinomonadaceae bacterium]